MARTKDHSILKGDKVWREMKTTFNPVINISKSINKLDAPTLKYFVRRPLTLISLNEPTLKLRNYDADIYISTCDAETNGVVIQPMKLDVTENRNFDDLYLNCKSLNNLIIKSPVHNCDITVSCVEKPLPDLDFLVKDIEIDTQQKITYCKYVPQNGVLCKYMAAVKKAKLDGKFSKHDQHKGILEESGGTVVKKKVEYGVCTAVVELENGCLGRAILSSCLPETNVGDIYLPVNKYCIYIVRGIKTFMYPDIIP